MITGCAGGVTTTLADSPMRSPITWFTALLVVCVIGPYVLGVPPHTRRERRFIAATIALLAWLLPLMAALR